MSKINQIVLVSLIVLIGLGLRFFAANHLPIVQDEPIYTAAGARYASHMREGKWNMLAWQDKNLEHPACFKILYGFVMLSQPKPDINITIDLKRFSPIQGNIGQRWAMAGRYTSAILGGLVVLVLAILNPIAGLFMAIQSTAVLYTSSVYLEALPLLGSILCAIFYLKWFESFQKSGRMTRQNFLWLFLSSGALGATVASKYTYGVVGLAIGVHYLIFALKTRLFSRSLAYMLGWGLFALFAFFVFNPYLWPHPRERLLASLTYHQEYASSEDVSSVDYPYWQVFYWLSGSIPTTVPEFKEGILIALDLYVSLLALAGLPILWKKNPLYLIWIILGLITLFLWPTKWTQYTMIILAPYCISAAAGFGWSFSWLQHTCNPAARRKQTSHPGYRG